MKETANMGLSIYEANDVTNYQIIYNGTMEKIDAYCGNLNSEVTKLNTDMGNTESSIENINTEITNLTTQQKTNTENITTLQGEMLTAQGNIRNLQTEIDNLETSVSINANMAGKIYRGILSTGESTVAIAIGNLKDDTLIDVYTDMYGLTPTSITTRSATSGQPNMVVLTFDVQTRDINVAVVARNTEKVSPSYTVESEV